MTATYTRLSLLSLLVLLAAGCGGNKSRIVTPPNAACVPSTKPEFAYQLSNQLVYSYTVNSCTGTFTATSQGSIATGATANETLSEAMVVDPLGRFVYVADLVSNATNKSTISMYTIDQATGVLTPTSPATVKTGFFPQGMGIDPLGRFVYTANSDDNTISMFTIDRTTGVLKPTSPATVASGWSPVAIDVDRSGKFAYASNQDDDTISMYTIDQSTGVLSPMTPATVAAGFSPFGVFFDPTGKFAYAPDSGSPDNRVSAFTVDPETGVLTPSKNGYVIAGKDPVAVAVDPSGKIAYVANRLDSTISMFSIDPVTGDLTLKSTVAAGSTPFRLTVDPSGKFLYAVNEDGASSVFTIGTDGTVATPSQATTANIGSFALAVAPSKN